MPTDTQQRFVKEIIDWFYNKYLDWQLHRIYPNGVSEEEYQRAKLILIRNTTHDKEN